MTARVATGEANHRSPASSGERPVDLVHLSRYSLGDRELEREILQLFQNQVPLYLDRLRAASTVREWREAAHSVKGSAKGVGAWGLAKQAERAEQVADPSVAGAGTALIALERAWEEANSYLGELLEGA
jgi:HPt (histidine-containing phosphotransfer) domain-containing protein